MKDYELNILDQYDIEVSSTHKTRGAILCDTNQGLLLLKESKLSARRVPMLERIYSHIEASGNKMIDRPVKNREGEIISSLEDGTRYALKRWFTGRECDVRRESEILEGIRNLARLHNIMVFDERTDGYCDISLKEEYLRHNRELKKTRTFIRGKTPKGDFELAFLECFNSMYLWASDVVQRLEESQCDRLYEESLEVGKVVHGEYNYHNILFTGEGTATTNFDHFYIDIQASDLYYFMRKVLEKHHWNEYLGREMIKEYRQIKPLSDAELEYVAIRLAYPEKFWKGANTYYNSNKAWISAKSVEKLHVSIKQMEEKREFLKNILSFNL